MCEVNSDLKKLEEKHKRELDTLRSDMTKAFQEKDDESRILLEEVRAELTAEIKKIEADKTKLQIDMHELRRQRAEEITQELSKAHERELAHQRAMADGNLKLQMKVAENVHQEELIKTRIREQNLEDRAAELERREAENSGGGGCLIM